MKKLTPEQATIKLFEATCSGSVKDAEAALAAGAELEATDQHGRTPLYNAVINGYTPLSLLLIESGADVNAQIEGGHDVLTACVWSKLFKVCEALLQKGAYVNTPSSLHSNAFTQALIKCFGVDPIEKEYYELAKLLFHNGATLSPRNAEDEMSCALDRLTTEVATEAKKAFPAGRVPTFHDCLTAHGKPTSALLSACATNQFVSLVAAPLLASGKPQDHLLLKRIWQVLPHCWQTHEAASRLLYTRKVSATTPPKSEGHTR